MEKSKTNLLISEEKFEKLAIYNDFYCISLYIPLEKTDNLYGRELLEKLIERLASLLASENITGQEASDYLVPIKRLLINKDLWANENQSKTLAVFVNQNSIYHFKINTFVQSCLHLTSNFYLLPLFDNLSGEKIKHEIDRLKNVSNEEEAIVNRVEKIIPLAFEGKIDTLYVSSTNGIYGIYDDDNKTTMIDEERKNTNMSLLNLAALQTFLNNGKVCLLEPEKMPVKGLPIQAIKKK